MDKILYYRPPGQCDTDPSLEHVLPGPGGAKRRAERAACPEQVAVSDVGLFTGDDRLTVPVGYFMVCWEDLCNPGVTRSASQAVYGMGWTMKMKRTPTKS